MTSAETRKRRLFARHTRPNECCWLCFVSDTPFHDDMQHMTKMHEWLLSFSWAVPPRRLMVYLQDYKVRGCYLQGVGESPRGGWGGCGGRR